MNEWLPMIQDIYMLHKYQIFNLKKDCIVL